MKLDELIVERRTIHDYKKAPVEWETIRKALELSLWSLNHKLTFPWVFLRLGPETREKIADLMVELKAKKKDELSEAMKDSIRSKIMNPAEVIFLGQKKSLDSFQAQEDYATIACSVQLASLWLWEQGIGSKWSTGGFTSHEKTHTILKTEDLKIEIVGCLFVGVPDRIPRASARPSLEKVLIETN